MLICCRVKDASKQERSFVFEGASVIIGSSGDVRVPGAKPLHASIEKRDAGQYFVVDKSGGHTLCNGQVVDKETQIRPGDSLNINGVEIVFLLTDKKAEVTAAPADAVAAVKPAAKEASIDIKEPQPVTPPPAAPPSPPENTYTSKGPVTLSSGAGAEVSATSSKPDEHEEPVLPPPPATTLGLSDAQPPNNPLAARKSSAHKASASEGAFSKDLSSQNTSDQNVAGKNLSGKASVSGASAVRKFVDQGAAVQDPGLDVPRVQDPSQSPASQSQPSVSQPQASASMSSGQKGMFGTFAPPSQSVIELKPKTGNAVEVSVLWGDRLVMMRHFKKACDVHVGSDPSNDLVLPLGVGVQKHKLFHKSEGGVGVSVSLPQGLSDGELVNQSAAKSLSSLNYGPGASVNLAQGEMLRLNLHDKVQLVVRYTEEAPDVVTIASSEFAMRETAGFLLAAMVAIVFSLYMSLYTSYTFKEEKPEERDRKATIVFKPVQKAQKIKKKTVTRVRTVKDPGKGQVKKAKAAQKKTKATAAKKTAKKSGASAKSKPPPKPSLESAGLLSAFGGGGIRSEVSKQFDGTGELLGDAQKATGRSGMGEDRAGVKMGLQTSRGKRDTVGAAAVRTGGKGSGAFGSGVGGLGAKGKMDLNLDVDDIETSSSIDREAIRRVVRRNVPAIRACYNQELNRNKNLRGKVVIEWDIADAGRVVGTRIKSNSMPGRRVADCIRRLIGTLTFPSPGANEVARVAFPFVFSSRSG